MNPKKIGNLIKDLRIKRDMSQEELANELFIDRSVISKWESGKHIPDLKYLVKMSEMFNVSLDELVYGETNNQQNQSAVKKNFLDYLVDQNTKYRRSKITTIFLSLAIVLIGITFLIYYFYETYNKTQVYRVGGTSENYNIIDGILITTREESYLKIGQIINRNNDNNEMVNEIKLIYKNNDKEIQVYKGTPDRILVDFFGYDSIINAKNIEDLKNNLYININDEIIKLNFKTNFTNDDMIFDNENGGVTSLSKTDTNIPTKIKEEFTLEDGNYVLEKDNVRLSYFIKDSTFYINIENNINISYSILLNKFIYVDKSNNNFIVNSNNEIKCTSANCHDEEELYNQYYNKYIKEYIFD